MPIAVPTEDKVKICIDRGGTFCDVIAHSDVKGDHLVKLLSVDPNNYDDAPTEGVRRVLEWFTGSSIPRDTPIDTSRVAYIRMGTTVATNALLERKGAKSALLITQGHRDALEIGHQARPHLFQMAVRRRGVLYSKVVEVEERLVPEWPEFLVDGKPVIGEGERVVLTESGIWVRELQPVNISKVTGDLQDLYDEGYRSIAVVLAHSYLLPEHELQVASIAESIGFENISVSSELQAKINLVARGQSATADAYLTPEVKQYLKGFSKGFKNELAGCQVAFMQSDGALAEVNHFSGLKAILSGPAGGVVGFARTSYDALDGSPVVGFDMGGTSTDVSRFSGEYEHVFETTTAGIIITTPQLDINTVAAGGGSILTYESEMFKVGPESAGAHPGPACYRKGGPLTVTDANLFLGRLHIDSFPKIFGPSEDMPLDYDVVKQKFQELTDKINGEKGSALTAAEVACGFINVANSSMARPIRALTEQRGFNANDHYLACFGGAGGQHATALATLLGMRSVVVHKYSSVLSAYGMGLADVAVDVSEPLAGTYGPDLQAIINERFERLRGKADEQLSTQSASATEVSYDYYLNLQYAGSDTQLMVLRPADGDFVQAFKTLHQREFAFTSEAEVLVERVRVRATAHGDSIVDRNASPYVEELRSLQGIDFGRPVPFTTNPVYFEETGSYVDAPVYKLQSLQPGQRVSGPAIVLDATQTIILHPANTATVLKSHVIIDVGLGPKPKIATDKVDPIRLSIFSHRFMGIAEQMCRALQKTAVSIQIKERLDFSCAIFEPEGQLVANAPSVPAHLGSMQYAIMFQAEFRRGQLRPGDVLVSNTPETGGNHLPDITVMAPVFEEGGDEIVFWVASRGHHTDIGGLGGNSGNPAITERCQEGAAFNSTYLVRDGVFNIQEVEQVFADAGKVPGCSPPAKLDWNISDLKAQCSACAVGAAQLRLLFKEFTKPVVHFYMKAVRDNAELVVKEVLKSYAGRRLRAVDWWDDGTPIKLAITIDPDTGHGVFDFTGTGPCVLTNYNTPSSNVYSGILYALRTISGTDMPMNGGVLAPLKVIVPDGTIVSATPIAPVFQGNSETTQRIVDVIFKAFKVMAQSHGCMNYTHLMYNDWAWGETIGGGAGAGPGWNGESGVHVNMTNTRIGDVEMFESRFPGILREFSFRHGTGGKGQYTGGNGLLRIYEARAPIRASHSGERRVIAPKGAAGGRDGGRGASYLNKRDHNGNYQLFKLRPSQALDMKTGEQLVIMTAGGAGYGRPVEPDDEEDDDDDWSIAAPAKALNNGQYFIETRANGSLAEYAATQNTEW